MGRNDSRSMYWRPVKDAIRGIEEANAGRESESFLILGAGIAGLAAAYELGRLGHDVEILEATENRVGGRLWTWHSEDGKFYGERAAMRIPDKHDYTRHYIAEAGLGAADLRPFVNSLGTGYLVVGDVVARESEYAEKIFPLFSDRLKDDERAAAEANPGGLVGLYMKDVMARLTVPLRERLVAGDFSDPFLRGLDQISWLDHFRKQNPSEAALEILGRVVGLAAVWHWSLAALLRDELNHEDPSFDEIIGGLDRLPHALREKLPDNVTIRFNQEILDLHPSSRGVRVLDRKTGERRFQPYRRLLVTLPFPVLAGMDLQEMSTAKREAIRNMKYASALKVLLGYDKRFWENDGIFGGRSKTDGPNRDVLYFRESYYPMDHLPAPAPAGSATEAPDGQSEAGLSFATESGDRLEGLFSLYVGSTRGGGEPFPLASSSDGAAEPGTLLGAYTLNAGADQLRDMSPGERVQTVLESLAAVQGGRIRRPDATFSFSFDDYPWAKGSLGITEPRFLVQHLAAAKAPERQIYFAGEGVSIAPGWIQGSLESALREVEAMLRSSEEES